MPNIIPQPFEPESPPTSNPLLPGQIAKFQFKPRPRKLLQETVKLLSTPTGSAANTIELVLNKIQLFLGMRTVFIAQTKEVEHNTKILNVVTVKNNDGCPLLPGIVGPLERTYCNTVFDTSAPLVIEDVELYPYYRELPSTKRLNIGSYIGVPLIYSNGQINGTLCAIDPLPLPINKYPQLLETLQILAHLIATNIENEERIQKANAENELKMRFIASVAHDLRSPLTSIISCSQILENPEEDLNQKRRDRCISLIKETSWRMLNQVEELLDFSAANANKIELALQPKFADPLAEAAFTMTSLEAERKHIDLEYRFEIPTDQKIVVDPQRFHRILVNLVGNAIKYTQPGGKVQLVITRNRTENGLPVFVDQDPFFRLLSDVVPFEDLTAIEWVRPPQQDSAPNPFDLNELQASQTSASPKDWIAFNVVDNGMGIRLADQQIIFDPYRQVKQLNLKPLNSHEGIGLGLSISSQFITLMGGQLILRSLEGKGSCFSVLLPAN